MAFLDLCEQYFGTSDFFEILNIPKDASEKQVRKAYYKLSLLYHPDRVEESKKAEATEKFKILGQVHVTLSNPEKRQIYIETGIYSDDEILQSQDWDEYWRGLFKKITLEDITKYEEQYKGSPEELNDIKRAYNQTKGDMDKIYEFVPFLTLKEENRVRTRIQELIDLKEVVAYDTYLKETPAKRDRRIRMLKKEEKEVEQDLKGGKIGLDSLSKAILDRRQTASESFLSDLENKYCGANETKKKRKK